MQRRGSGLAGGLGGGRRRIGCNGGGLWSRRWGRGSGNGGGSGWRMRCDDGRRWCPHCLVGRAMSTERESGWICISVMHHQSLVYRCFIYNLGHYFQNKGVRSLKCGTPYKVGSIATIT